LLQFQINDVLLDELGLIDKERLPVQFAEIIDKKSLKKAADFWAEIIQKEYIFEFEMYVNRENKEPQPLKFSGGSFHDQVWVIAAAHNKELQKMLNEMMLMNNEPVSLVITSCGRFDLLQTTFESFKQHNTYRNIRQLIVIDDSGHPVILTEVVRFLKLRALNPRSH